MIQPNTTHPTKITLVPGILTIFGAFFALTTNAPPAGKAKILIAASTQPLEYSNATMISWKNLARRVRRSPEPSRSWSWWVLVKTHF